MRNVYAITIKATGRRDTDELYWLVVCANDDDDDDADGWARRYSNTIIWGPRI